MPYSKHTTSKYVVMFLMSVALSIMLLMCINTKQPLQNATVSQLDAIEGIGYEVACQIEQYMDENPNAKVEDLDSLPWVGQKKIEKIRKVFR